MPSTVAEPGDNFPAIDLPSPRFDDTGAAEPRVPAPAIQHGSFPTQMLPAQTLSDLLWAACGVNRGNGVLSGVPTDHATPPPVTRRRSTSTSRWSRASISTIPTEHGWRRCSLGDLRPLVADPSLARSGDKAPVRLIYVADVDRLEQHAGIAAEHRRRDRRNESYYFVDCGIVAANVYLFAAAAGLSTWFHDCDRLALAKRLPLRAGRRVLFGQTVGFPG